MARPVASVLPDVTRSPGGERTAFLVRGIFVLGTRSLFIVRGTVVGGTARVGQRVLEPPGMEAAVAGVESGLLDVTGGAPQVALTFRYTKQAQLARWSALVAEGTLLTLVTPS